MVRIVYISLFSLLFLLSSCQKNKAKISKVIPLEAFEEVRLNSPFEIILVEDTVYFIEISGFEKSVEKINVQVENKILTLENTSKSNFLHPKTKGLTIFIHALPLKKIEANETCHITTQNPITSADFGLIMRSKANFADLELNGTVFYYWNNYPCGGKLTLRGNTDQLKIWNTAIFSVDAKNLTTNYGLVENSSKGKCEVNVTGNLEYSITGEGDIEVYGNPSIIVEKALSGKGKLIIK